MNPDELEPFAAAARIEAAAFDAAVRRVAENAAHTPGRDELWELWERVHTDPASMGRDVGEPFWPTRGWQRPVPYTWFQRLGGPYIHLGRLRLNAIQAVWAWAVTCPEALSALVALGPLVEIGAGTGWWAMRIRESGGDIVAWDNVPYQNDWCRHRWGSVRRGGPGMAGRYPDRALLLCWPPRDESMAYRAATVHADAGGTTIAYIGEQNGGVSADAEFHRLLHRRYEPVEQIAIPQWDGLHDELVIYRRPARRRLKRT
jgi:hypothetical protein